MASPPWTVSYRWPPRAIAKAAVAASVLSLIIVAAMMALVVAPLQSESAQVRDRWQSIDHKTIETHRRAFPLPTFPTPVHIE